MKKIIATLLLAGSSIFAGPRVYFGAGIRVPAPVVVAPAPVYVAPPVVGYVPPSPGPGYSWIGGSWVFVGGHRVWHPGYWRGPAYAPRYYRHR
jgi:hypothetical protein